MGELLRLVFVLAAIWLALRLLKRHSTPHFHSHREPSANRPSGGVTMLPCARCGVYIPQDDAIRSEGRVYCSREHALRGPDQP